ncbi:hypothetical protein ACFYY9_18530 [Streptomyces nigra]|uniref:hypothetical protein n=1 Tax=Streptomyces nigra TaxID=1827580 RepID=UPI0036959F91
MVIVSSLDTAGRGDLVAARIMSTTDPHALGGLMSVVGEGEGQIPAFAVPLVRPTPLRALSRR